VIKLSRSLICLAVLVLTGTSAIAQQPSLSDIAKQEEQRRESVTEPSKVYTDADLERFARPSEVELGPATSVAPSGSSLTTGDESSCQSEEKQPDTSGNHFVVQRCSDRTNIWGSNLRTGSKWQWSVFPDGSEVGIDSCGVRWTYDAKTTVYKNSNGEIRFGEGDSRVRLEAATRCEVEPVQRTEAEQPVEESPSRRVVPPVWVVIPGDTPGRTPAGKPEPTPQEIERGRTGGTVWPCENPNADPNRCLVNGGLRER
jgi:hypothetical protein